jgi:hypothetical protein
MDCRVKPGNDEENNIKHQGGQRDITSLVRSKAG